jgi:alanine racemase
MLHSVVSNDPNYLYRDSKVSRNTYALIHGQSLIQNFLRLQGKAPHSRTLAVVKANAYGHGSVQVAQWLQNYCDGFVVAMMEEAMELRRHNISLPITVLQGAHDVSDIAQAYQHNITLLLHSDYQIEWWLAAPPKQRPSLWLKVDSGMHRLGFSAHGLRKLLTTTPELITPETVLASHFACADEPDSPLSLQQLQLVQQLAQDFSLPISVANSAATLGISEARGDWNRLGIALYGGAPFAHETGKETGLQPVMSLHSTVIALRDLAAGESIGYGQQWTAAKASKIAVVAIGYADGYPRYCPSGTPVAVNQQLCPLAGRVSMDMLTVDVTELAHVAIGDPVELWGNSVSIDTVASYADTISYTLMTGVSQRVPRRYLEVH